MFTRNEWIKLGNDIGELVAEKNAAYGDSVRKVARIVNILYPDGVQSSQVPALLFTIRIVDKLSRIANDPEYGGEDPVKDITGYALLMQELVMNGLEPKK